VGDLPFQTHTLTLFTEQRKRTLRKSIATIGILLSLVSPTGLAAKAEASSVQSQVQKTTQWKCPQWHSLMKKYKLPIKTFDSIMYRESRCKAKVIGWNYRAGMSHRNCKLSPADTYKKCHAVRSYDSGLLQINSSWTTLTSQVCRSKWGDMTVLLNPHCNLKVASYLYHKGGGMSNWRGTSGSN
jgi:hypothetical protein